MDKSKKIDSLTVMLFAQINILINQVFLATVTLRFLISKNQKIKKFTSWKKTTINENWNYSKCMKMQLENKVAEIHVS